MKALRNRLEGFKDEVLEVTRTFGRFRAMTQFHISDYACFRKWLEEVTGDENYGLNPTIKSDVRQSLGDQLVAAFLRKVAQLEAENERLKHRADFLEWQLSNPAIKEEYQALAILQSCEV